MSRGLLISSCKKDLLDIYTSAIEAVKPDILIKNALTIKDNRLSVKDHRNGHETNLDLNRSSLHLIGGGKSVMGMASGIAQVASQAGVTNLFSLGCLSVPVDLRGGFDSHSVLRDQLNSLGVRCLFGAKDNLPDENSVRASRSILESIEIACGKDAAEEKKPLFIVVISGGGSACLSSPKLINLETKLQLIKYLVQKGANIVELNKVRRYFSSIKGGGLARHILRSHPESRILTLILSDVIGDPIEYIASGPTYISPDYSDSHTKAMLNILEKYGYPNEQLSLQLSEQYLPTRGVYDEGKVRNFVIGNNTTALTAAITRAQTLNYQVDLISNKLEGYSEDVVERIRNFGEQTFVESRQNKILIVGGGEATINKLNNDSWGKGGRSQEMALDYMISRCSDGQEKSAIENSIDVFLAGGTDGQDGPTDVAGCMASVACNKELNCGEETFNLDKLLQAKRHHDSYNFWTEYRPDWLIKTGLTGTNVMDLYMYLLCKE